MLIHDMKVPLSFMMGSLQMLLEQKTGKLNRDQTDLVNLTLRGCRRLETMISNLLDVERLEEGKLEIKREVFSLRDSINERLKYWQQPARIQNKQLIANYHYPAANANCDRHLLERILENLLSNAFKHTREASGRIELEVAGWDEPAGILFRVKDNGEGIPEAFFDRIFDKYAIVAGQELGLKSDTGLGLTFCKMAVEAMGGKIWVESLPGHGSVFSFYLPSPAPAGQ